MNDLQHKRNMAQVNYTKRVEHILLTGEYNKVSLSERLGITRPTLNTRLEQNNWKKGEIALINSVYSEVSKIYGESDSD